MDCRRVREGLRFTGTITIVGGKIWRRTLMLLYLYPDVMRHPTSTSRHPTVDVLLDDFDSRVSRRVVAKSNILRTPWSRQTGMPDLQSTSCQPP